MNDAEDNLKKLRAAGLIRHPLPPGWDEDKLKKALTGLDDDDIESLSEAADGVKKAGGRVGAAIECFIPL